MSGLHYHKVPWWHSWWHRRQLRGLSDSTALLQPGSVLMSMSPDTVEGLANARGLGCHLGPYWGPIAKFSLEPCSSEWPALPPGTNMTSKAGLLMKTMSGSVVCVYVHGLWSHQMLHRCLGSRLSPVARLAPEGHASLSDLPCHLGPW